MDGVCKRMSHLFVYPSCRYAIWLCFFLTGCLWSVVGHAQESPPRAVKIAILPHSSGSGVDMERKAWIERLVHWALNQQERISVLSHDEVQQKLLAQSLSMTPADQARVRVLQTFLLKAKKLYQLRRYDFTLKALDIAEKVAAKVRIYLTQPDPVRELYLYRALSYMGLRDGLKTREYVMRTIQFDTNYQPPSEGIPSSFLSYYQVLRQWILRRPTYNIVINTVPSGAKIYINLQYQGTSPMTLTVVPGKHLLRLEKPGYSHWERLANIAPERLGTRRSISVSVPLERDPRTLTLDNIPIFAKGADIDDNILDRLEKICERLSAQHLYIVATYRQDTYGLRIASYRKGSRQIQYKRVNIGASRQDHRQLTLAYAKALAQQIAPAPPRPVVVRRPPPRPRPRPVDDDDTPRRIDPPVVRREEEPPPRPRPRVVASDLTRPTPEPVIRRTVPPTETSTPFYQTWWFWTVTIGVTAAIGVTVAVILTQTAPPPTATLIITTENPERGN